MAATRSPRRWAVVVCALIGFALIAAPFAFGMFTRAPQGATMLSAFKPFMTSQRLAGFQSEIGQIDSAVHETNTTVAQTLAEHGSVAVSSGAYRDFASQWPQIHSTMADLLDKVQANLPNYQAVAGLPSFTLFPWFFLIPGIVIAIAALLTLLRPAAASGVRVLLAVLGIGLLAAPLLFGMFTKAPKGGDMMSAFQTIETSQNVTKIQGYFGAMAAGQGALRLDVVPALAHTGLSSSQLAKTFPDVAALDKNWIHILNDMTPMIGAMSDSVGHYQALQDLPPFPLFPWFFAVPGVLLAGLALGPAFGRETARNPAEGAA
jgi:hypothetical protein